MIWRGGVLPPDAPQFSPQLSYDLHSYAYGLLGLGLRMLEMNGDAAQARVAFVQAATALESVMAKGNRGESDRDFHFVMAGASYHLAQLSARAYSLLAIVVNEENFSPLERTLALLMRRSITTLRTLVHDYRLNGEGSDARITGLFQARLAEENNESAGQEAPERDGHDFLWEGLDIALTDNFFGAISIFLLALDRGERALVDQAIGRLAMWRSLRSPALPSVYSLSIPSRLIRYPAIGGTFCALGFAESLWRPWWPMAMVTACGSSKMALFTGSRGPWRRYAFERQQMAM